MNKTQAAAAVKRFNECEPARRAAGREIGKLADEIRRVISAHFASNDPNNTPFDEAVEEYENLCRITKQRSQITEQKARLQQARDKYDSIVKEKAELKASLLEWAEKEGEKRDAELSAKYSELFKAASGAIAPYFEDEDRISAYVEEFPVIHSLKFRIHAWKRAVCGSGILAATTLLKELETEV